MLLIKKTTMAQKILIIDFGSQYTQLIACRIREMNVYCEIYPYNNFPKLDSSIAGVILSGSPFSVSDTNAPKINLSDIQKQYPLLGICYGAQFLAQTYGGQIQKSENREYGRAELTKIDTKNPLFAGMSASSQVWMSHGDTIISLPDNFENIAQTTNITNAAFQIKGEETYGIQFHPEVHHSTEGTQLLKNFVTKICGAKQGWTPDSFINNAVDSIKKQVGDDTVILGLSGGVDSTVAAVLLNRAIGKNLHCIFVNNGLLRKNEFPTVLENYKVLGLNVKGVDASEAFLKALANISDPEQKRKAIGKTFIDVFESEAKQIKGAKWLAQGTIYPDVIESVSVNGPSVTIKSHHNVGGLPERMNLKIVEPLRMLFKDDVRRIGKALSIPEKFINRHPFPGPGLAIRIIGDITREKVAIIQEVDDIFISMLREHNLYDKVWQAGAILLPIHSVGVMGDERTYEQVVALRAVNSIDGMTADWVHLPYEFLALVSNQIINKVRGVNRVVYDISSKPPATIEWE